MGDGAKLVLTGAKRLLCGVTFSKPAKALVPMAGAGNKEEDCVASIKKSNWQSGNMDAPN
jgi:hypothetical protein